MKRKIWIERRPDGDHRFHFNEPHPSDEGCWTSEPWWVAKDFGGFFGYYLSHRVADGFGVGGLDCLKPNQVQEIEYELTTIWERE